MHESKNQRTHCRLYRPAVAYENIMELSKTSVIRHSAVAEIYHERSGKYNFICRESEYKSR